MQNFRISLKHKDSSHKNFNSKLINYIPSKLSTKAKEVFEGAVRKTMARKKGMEGLPSLPKEQKTPKKGVFLEVNLKYKFDNLILLRS